MKGEGLTLLFFWSKSIRLPLETWASRPRLTLIHIFSPFKCIILPVYLQITKINIFRQALKELQIKDQAWVFVVTILVYLSLRANARNTYEIKKFYYCDVISFVLN